MDIQFDPFSFVVASLALAVAVVQLCWNRPHRRAQVCVFTITILSFVVVNLMSR